MNIQYYGHSCFKLSTKPAGRGQEELVIFFDPFDKKIGLRPPQGQADIILTSHGHYDHNNTESIKGNFRVINIPGEYSLLGINIIGIDSYHDPEKGALRGRNTIFLLESEDIKVCHLGDLGTELNAKQMEEIGDVDVLMIPIGGNYTIDAKKAVEIIKKIEPKVVIPMHYKIEGSIVDVASEEEFCEEIGNCSREKNSRLNLKKKDLEEKKMEVILMSVS